FYPLAFVIILIFALGLSGGVFFGLENLDRVGLTAIIEKPQVKFTGSGLILGSGRNQTIVLGSPNEPGRAKFVKIESVLPGNLSLSYQGQDTPLYQMRLPFFPEESGFFNSVNRDIVHNVRTFSVRYNAGYLAFGIYAGSLAAFLISLGCMVNISYWSLANLFFGALAFRGALALENFFDQRNINSLLSSFAGNMIPESFMGSIIFCALCVLILLYSGLVYLARGRISDG
ncbi:MAG: hypothetical protein LBH07_06015, partial [Treponema sp.]|nr:hypothetical protein [Treponema sp.]